MEKEFLFPCLPSLRLYLIDSLQGPVQYSCGCTDISNVLNSTQVSHPSPKCWSLALLLLQVFLEGRAYSRNCFMTPLASHTGDQKQYRLVDLELTDQQSLWRVGSGVTATGLRRNVSQTRKKRTFFRLLAPVSLAAESIHSILPT